VVPLAPPVPATVADPEVAGTGAPARARAARTGALALARPAAVAVAAVRVPAAVPVPPVGAEAPVPDAGLVSLLEVDGPVLPVLVEVEALSASPESPPLAFGVAVGLMGRLEPGEGYEGAKRERGFFEVKTNNQGIFQHLPENITVWHSHFDEVKSLPPGFEATAANEACAIQAMQHNDRPLFGVQFHPELFDDAHPDGRRILENFLDL
jgi:GMP synthase (glutamine-hydrolysing)